MLRADRHRIAQSERVGFERARFAGASFALVGDENRRLAGFAHKIGEGPIGRSCARARIDQKENASACATAVAVCACIFAERLSRRRILETGRVDHPKERSPSLPSPSRRSRVTPG